MNKALFYELVAREISGMATDAELGMLRAMIADHLLEAEYAKIKSTWEAQLTSLKSYPYSMERVRKQIVDGIRKTDPNFTMGAPVEETPVIPWRRIISVAATVLLIVCAWVYYQAEKIQESTGVTWLEKQTAAGQNTTIHFTDGSKIVLNGASRIRFPESFEHDRREVFFSGEGYFEIAKNPDRPFVVHVGDYEVQVLGTVFNVDAYEPAHLLKVSLLEGKVRVQDTAKETLLNPGEEVTINLHTGLTEVDSFDPLQVTGWKDKVFVFEGEPLCQVLDMLSHRYGVDFHCQSKAIANCKINASFSNETVWTILEALKYAAGIEYTIRGNEVELTGKGCH